MCTWHVPFTESAAWRKGLPAAAYCLMAAINAAMTALFVRSLRRLPSLQATVLSTAANMAATGLLGQLLFAEHISTKWAAGIALVTAGLLLICKSVRQAAATAGLDDDPTEQLGKLSYRMLVSYDGTAYSGWQLQARASTIQGQIERALSTVLREGRRCLGVCAAGRTDAGVHARGQVVQFFTNSSGIDPAALPYKLNSLLPPDIRVFWMSQTAPDFNVTVSALRKTYHYSLDTGAVQDPLRSRYAHHPRRPLDLAAMRGGAALLLGRHDFTQFSNNSAERLRRNPVKTLERLEVVAEGPSAVRLEVRHMTGALLALAEGRITQRDIAARLEVGSNQPPGAGGFWRGYNVAPAKGLQLFEVQYPPGVDDPATLLYPDLPHDDELWNALSRPPALGNMTGPALAQAEARLNNQTVSLLASLLEQSSSSSGGTELGVANGVWTKQLPVLKDFADSMWRLYKTPVKAVNSTDPINKWARDKTGGRITQSVPPGTPFDLIVTNAVYFRAAWQFAFDPDATLDQDFTTYVNATPQVVQVKMMYRKFRNADLTTGEEVLYGSLPGRFRAVKLPYKGSSIVAYAVLPDLTRYNASVDAAAADVGPELLFNASLWMPLWRFGGKLEVQLPRFKISTNQIQLKQALRALNITVAFSQKAANFSRLSEQPLFITNVLQSVSDSSFSSSGSSSSTGKTISATTTTTTTNNNNNSNNNNPSSRSCFIDGNSRIIALQPLRVVINVDEKGTEAAAVTTSMMTVTEYIPETVPPLVFDRPFLFWIVDDATQTVLFQGTVKDPSASDR
ncbi:pseudouridine synthase [Scenedesmus sp. NREL 46B-D3]|nr:pseudouridine synthase [Scenedesmus sp. NREL 46B-D3]